MYQAASVPLLVWVKWKTLHCTYSCMHFQASLMAIMPTILLPYHYCSIICWKPLKHFRITRVPSLFKGVYMMERFILRRNSNHDLYYLRWGWVNKAILWDYFAFRIPVAWIGLVIVLLVCTVHVPPISCVLCTCLMTPVELNSDSTVRWYWVDVRYRDSVLKYAYQYWLMIRKILVSCNHIIENTHKNLPYNSCVGTRYVVSFVSSNLARLR